jgi:hypothetical protein
MLIVLQFLHLFAVFPRDPDFIETCEFSISKANLGQLGSTLSPEAKVSHALRTIDSTAPTKAFGKFAKGTKWVSKMGMNFRMSVSTGST